MPFQSEKQRRYLHANHPEIAKRWERNYAGGGIAELNAQLNSLPEYYLPKNHGGLIPSHEAGIYGLAEGGQLVKPGPGRPGYGGPHETYGGGVEAGRSSGPSDRGPRDDPDRFGPTTTSVPPGEKGGPGYISPKDLKTLGGTTGDGDGKITIDELYESNKPKRNRSQVLLGKLKAKYPNFFQLDTAKKINQIKNMSWKDALNLEKQMSKNPFGVGYTGKDKIGSAKYISEGFKSTILDPSKWSSKIGGATPLAKKLAVLAGEKVLPAVMGGANIIGAPLSYVQGASMLQNFLESQGMPKGALSDDILGKGAEAAGADILSVPTDIYSSSQEVPPEYSSTWEGQAGGIAGLKHGGRTGFFTGMREAEQQEQQDRATRGPRDDPDRFGPTTTTTTTTTKDTSTGDGDARENYISTQTYPERFKTVETHVPHTDETVTTQIRDYHDPKGHQKRAPQTTHEKSLLDKIAFWTGAIVTGGGLLGIKVPGAVKTVNTALSYRKNINWGINKLQELGVIDKSFTVDEVFQGFVDDAKKRKAKTDEYKLLPPGHPDRVALEIELEIGKKPEHLGDDGGTQETGIKIDDIEGYNEKIRASTEWRQKQTEVDRSKQMAYWRMMMQPYMSAQGGRVPAGYNTGGLSNLFRLKNR